MTLTVRLFGRDLFTLEWTPDDPEILFESPEEDEL